MILKSINYWSFPGGLEGTLDVFEAMALAKQYGYQAIELAISEAGSLNLDSNQAFCERIVSESNRIGIQLESVASGTYWGRNLADPTAEGRAAAKQDLEKMIRITSWLGAKTLLTIPGAVDVFFLPDRPAISYDVVLKNAHAGLASVLPLAAASGVRLGIENVWNKFLLSPTEMASFIDSFDSTWLGAYVDVGNMLPYGHPEQWIRILRHRVVGIHFKDFRRSVGTADGFLDLLEGDVDWPEVMRAIGEINYQGPIAAEMIPGYKHYPLVRIANTSNAMDAILGL